MPLQLAITGATGRMGRELIAGVAAESDLKLVAALTRQGNPAVGRDAHQGVGVATGVLLTADLAEIAKADVAIDFSRPAATCQHVGQCAELRKPIVVGTTGLSADDHAQLRAAAAHIPIVLAPNTALGVNVLFKLVADAAQALHREADIEIIEAHHRRKIDAPSGTALRLGEVIASAMGKSLADVAVYERYGETGERKPASIGFATVRGGDIIGDHTALFALAGERIEITHRSQSRSTYVHGAFAAARFLARQPAGLYDMFDVLGLR